MAHHRQRREKGEGQTGLSGETVMDRFERDSPNAARPPECPECDPPAQPDKAYPETPAPNPDRQPLRTPPEAPMLPDSHPEATPGEYPE